MIIIFHKKFKKNYQKLDPSIQRILDIKLLMFAKNPFLPLLNNHRLKGKFTGYRSINITGDYRGIYKEINEQEALFVLIGTHSQLYK